MATVKEIANYLEQLIPTRMKMDFDNCGFLVGDGNKLVNKVMLTLDITDEVIEEAKEYGADLIVSHHPLFFSTASATTDTLIGRKIVALLESRISAICLHTNLDAAAGGVNDALMDTLGIQTEGVLEPAESSVPDSFCGMGRFGTLSKMPLEQFLALCKERLHCNGLRYVSGGVPVRKVAVCGGSGSSMLHLVAEKGCDTYVTGDVKHNGFLDARELGINLIDAGHFSTENVVIPVLLDILHHGFPALQVQISFRHQQPEQFY